MSNEFFKLTEVPGDAEPDQPDHEEISLAELSRAYAQVMRDQGLILEAEAAEMDDADERTEGNPYSAKDQLNQQPASTDQTDVVDNGPCPISPQSIVEAILFVGVPTGGKLTLRKIAALMRDVSPQEVKQAITDLNHRYERRGAAFRIVQQAGDYKMQLVDEMNEVQNHYFGRNRAAKLSQPAIDVLAIVAYHQPIQRAQVDQLRTRPSGNIVSQLIRRDLVAEVQTEVQSASLVTTDRFLQIFGMSSLDDLPRTSPVTDLEELIDW